MRFSRLFFIITVCSLLSGVFTVGAPPLFSAQEKEASLQNFPKFKVYYFYTFKRCGPCRKIEKWSQEAIETNFQKEIEAGELQWQALNAVLPENKHFVEDFKLYTKSVVVVELKDNVPVRWTILEDVWKLYGDQEKFFNYVVDSTRQFMEKG